MQPLMGLYVGLKAFVAAVIGGIGHVPGAVVGALLLGLVEEFVVGYTASSWRDAVAFGFLILVLLVRPEGLFGRVDGGEGLMRVRALAVRSRGPAWLRGVAAVLVAIAVLALLQLLVGDCPFFVYLASLVGVNVILAVSLNIVNGMTGQFSIGHAGFMAVGAYIAGKLSLALKDVRHLRAARRRLATSCSSWCSLLVGRHRRRRCAASSSACRRCGCAGDYLAIVTLGFGEIIRVVVQNTEAFGRALGLSGIPQTLDASSWSGSGSS